MKSRSRQILDKSIAAILSAIEIYNKPNFTYREESFSVLAINAWELLFKARLLQLANNRLSSILEYERRQRQNGELSKKLYRKKNRTGNYSTVGIFKALNTLINDFGDTIPMVIRSNLEALGEIRDNSVHFLNNDFTLRKTIHEIGSASTRNYLHLVRQWFGTDLRQYNIFLMPIAFIRDVNSAEGIALNSQERKLLEYVQTMKMKHRNKLEADFAFTLDVELRIKKSRSDSRAEVVISNSSEAIPVYLDEEQIKEIYPWDYQILITRLRRRFSNFKITPKFHRIKKELEFNSKYCNTRFLDPGNPKSSKKKFYNPNIIKEFDKHYERLVNE